jgi:phosphomannomutase
MSALIRPLAKHAQSGEINFQHQEKDAAIAALKESYGKSGQIDELDGITIDAFSKSGWWINVRKSNTEPLLRLNAEAKTETALKRILNEVSPKLGQRVAH